MPSANGGDSMKIMEDMRKDMKRYCYKHKLYFVSKSRCPISSVVEHFIRNEKVHGSIP